MNDGLITDTRQIAPARAQRFVDVLNDAGYTVERDGQVLRVSSAEPISILDVASILADRGMMGYIPIHRYMDGSTVVLMIGTTIGVPYNPKPAATSGNSAQAKRKSRKA